MRTCELVVASAADDPAAATRRRRRDARDGRPIVVGTTRWLVTPLPSSLAPRVPPHAPRVAEGSSPGPAPRRDDGAGVDGDAGGASLRARAARRGRARLRVPRAPGSERPVRRPRRARARDARELERRGQSVAAPRRGRAPARHLWGLGRPRGAPRRRGRPRAALPRGEPGQPVQLSQSPRRRRARRRPRDAAPARPPPGGHHPPRRSLPRGRAALGAAECLARLAASHPSHAAAMADPRALASAAADLAADARLRRRHLQTPRRRGATRRRQVRNEARREGPPRRRDPPRGRRDGRVRARSAARRGNPPGRREGRRGDAAEPPPRDPPGNRRSASASRAPVQHDRRPDRRVRVRVGARGRAGGFRVWTDPPGTLAEGARGEGRGDSGRGDSGRGDSGLERAFPRSIPNASAGTELASLLVRCLEDADEDARRAASDALGKLAASRVAALVAAADQSDQSGGGGGDSGDSGFGGGASSPLGLARSGSGSGGSGSTSVFGAMFGGSGSSGRSDGRDVKAERAKALAAEATEAARANARIAFAPLDLRRRVAASAWVETGAVVFAAPFVRGAGAAAAGSRVEEIDGWFSRTVLSSRDARARRGSRAWAGALRAMEARSVGRRARKLPAPPPRRSRRAPSTPPWTRRGRRRGDSPAAESTRIGAAYVVRGRPEAPRRGREESRRGEAGGGASERGGGGGGGSATRRRQGQR